MKPNTTGRGGLAQRPTAAAYAVAALAMLATTGASAQVRVLEESYQRPGQTAPAARPAEAGALPIDDASLVVDRAQPYQLRRDQPIHTQLQAWARHSGWELLWYPNVSWRVVQSANLSNHRDVVAAVSAVINILRDEGKAVRLHIAEGNRVMEVRSTDVRGND